MPDRKMVSMNKEEAVKIILDSINADNRELCLKNGMSEEQTNSQIEQSQASLAFMIGNACDKLEAAGIKF